MNQLEGVNRFKLEAGLHVPDLITTVGQTGEMAELVAWFDAAYEDIQNLFTRWRFMNTQFSFPTIADTKAYTPAAVSITNHASWKWEDIRIYDNLVDEVQLTYEPWEVYRFVRDIGVIPTGRPTHVSVKPDESLIFWPTPDKVYTVTGERYISPDILVANTGVPIMPVRFHMAIVWRALIYYAESLAAPESLAKGDRNYKRVYRSMYTSQIAKENWAEPLT